MSRIAGAPRDSGYVGRFRRLWEEADSGLRHRILAMIALLLGFNAAVWSILLMLSARYALLAGLAPLAYSFGLRHAVDPDHIAAIDNTTRKLMRDGKRPVAVGLFFSLGHSTIVLALSILIATSAAYVRANLPSFQTTGAVVGTSISGLFLLLIAAMNLVVLGDIYRAWRGVMRGSGYDAAALEDYLQNRGLLARLFRPLLALMTDSRQMYVVGLLFGLGFDTASEVGILGISATAGASAMPAWFILILPLLFVAGMALVDTLDGIAMLGAYGWAYIRPVRKLYYNLNITLVSVLVAVMVGGIELLSMVATETGASGGIWSLAVNAPYDVMGYAIIALFLMSWLVSVLVYRMRHLNRWDEEIVHVSFDRPYLDLTRPDQT